MYCIVLCCIGFAEGVNRGERWIDWLIQTTSNKIKNKSARIFVSVGTVLYRQTKDTRTVLEHITIILNYLLGINMILTRRENH